MTSRGSNSSHRPWMTSIAVDSSAVDSTVGANSVFYIHVLPFFCFFSRFTGGVIAKKMRFPF
jgi:hypothetical protein